MAEAKKPAVKKPVTAKKPAAKKPAAKKPAAKKPAAKKPAVKKPLKGGFQEDLDRVNFSNFNRDQATVEQAAEYKVYLKKQELRQAEEELAQVLSDWEFAGLPGRPGIDEGMNMKKMNDAAARRWPNASNVRGEHVASPLITSAWADMNGARR